MTLDPTLPVLGRAVPNGDVPSSAGSSGAGPAEAVSSDRATVARQWRDRRTLERRLHDGAALRISALSLRLGLLRHALARGEREFDAAVEALQDELHLVLQELRDVEGLLYPPLLDEAGIGPALREAAARCPVPVHIDAADERFDPAAEGAAYFALLGCLPQPRRCSDDTAAGGPDDTAAGGPDDTAAGGPDDTAAGGPDDTAAGGPDETAAGGPDGVPDGGWDGGGGRAGRGDALALAAPVDVVVRRDGDVLVMLVTGVDACHAGAVHDEVRLLGGTVAVDAVAVGGGGPVGPVAALMTVRIPCA